MALPIAVSQAIKAKREIEMAKNINALTAILGLVFMKL
jgi:hypothetical protein